MVFVEVGLWDLVLQEMCINCNKLDNSWWTSIPDSAGKGGMKWRWCVQFLFWVLDSWVFLFVCFWFDKVDKIRNLQFCLSNLSLFTIFTFIVVCVCLCMGVHGYSEDSFQESFLSSKYVLKLWDLSWEHWTWGHYAIMLTHPPNSNT